MMIRDYSMTRLKSLRPVQGQRISRALGICVAILVTSVLSACGSSTASHAPASITVVDATGNKFFGLLPSGKLALRVVVSDAAGSTIANAVVSFTSRNPQVVTVDAAGVVTGIAVGTTNVVASTVDGGRTLSDSVRVSVGTLTSSP
jgi:uncharacterized protein YbjQ (UPF0145 family)